MGKKKNYILINFSSVQKSRIFSLIINFLNIHDSRIWRSEYSETFESFVSSIFFISRIRSFSHLSFWYKFISKSFYLAFILALLTSWWSQETN